MLFGFALDGFVLDDLETKIVEGSGAAGVASFGRGVGREKQR